MRMTCSASEPWFSKQQRSRSVGQNYRQVVCTVGYLAGFSGGSSYDEQTGRPLPIIDQNLGLVVAARNMQSVSDTAAIFHLNP